MLILVVFLCFPDYAVDKRFYSLGRFLVHTRTALHPFHCVICSIGHFFDCSNPILLLERLISATLCKSHVENHGWALPYAALREPSRFLGVTSAACSFWLRISNIRWPDECTVLATSRNSLTGGESHQVDCVGLLGLLHRLKNGFHLIYSGILM